MSWHCSQCDNVCMCLLTPAKDFRGRFSDDRAMLELFQKALNELEHVMKGVCACVCLW